MSDRELAQLERQALLSPGDVQVLIRLGQRYERAQRLRDAFLAYTRARQIAPDDPVVVEHWRRLGGGEEARFCERMMTSPLNTDRAHAASMLGVCGGEVGRAALRHALARDAAFAVRHAAAAALAELRADEALGDLVAALDDTNPWVRARAADALHRLVHGRGYDTLTTTRSRLEPLVQQWKTWWLEQQAGEP